MENHSPYKLLVIEDDENIAGFICLNLQRAGFIAANASSGELGLDYLRNDRFDLVILDIALPGIDGFEVCRIIRKSHPDTAIIMVTARGMDIDKIKGLELGADDYVVKPFNPDELTARVRSVLRRSHKIKSTKGLKIDIEGRRVFLTGREVRLTNMEFELLLYLYKHKGKALTRNELLNAVWGEDFFGEEKTLDVHIRRLREKIEEDPSNPKRIATVWSVGFRYDGEAGT